MIDRLVGMGLNLFVVSNEARDKKAEEAIGLPAQHFLYHSDCGNKGSKKYGEKVMALTNSARNEIVYLGDSEQDMWEASGNKFALFNADWSQTEHDYGFGEESPQMFADDIQRYFLKEHNWFFTVDGQDALGRSVEFRALLDPDTCKDQGITPLLKQRDENFHQNQRQLDLATHLITHLVASIYLEGIHLDRVANNKGGQRIPLWCLYPGASGGISPVLELFEEFTSRLLRMKYVDDLIQRHTHIMSSKEHRLRFHTPQPIEDQFNSIQINPAMASKVKGNVVLVADDFSTGTNAMEVSRNLLYACGASKVIGITVGKYGRDYTSYVPAGGVVLPSKGGPVEVDENSVVSMSMSVARHNEAIADF